ncbi:MFS family permease [Sinorhizobium kostiense]|uniref:MFS family permease n=1 Tax=Sinorhizobium kostiense TaxID=76747 RepID=A0ABS4QZU6_9HYPH|nr:MFS transporter [Sinorhizobium kostiense]MBP2236154.1 MFS family permease [Sinorhizobium kostiense]
MEEVEHPFWQALKDRTFLLGTTAALLGYFAFLVTCFLSSLVMTQLTEDPSLVAFVNAAVQAPLLFVILPAAAVARLIDRRILLMAVNLAISCVLFCMGLESTSLHPTPVQVLVLIFSLGTLAAFSMSVWQISGPDVVAKSMVAGATVTVSAGFNLARAVAPVFGAASLKLLGFQVTLISGAILALIGAFLPMGSKWPNGPAHTLQSVSADRDSQRKNRRVLSLRRVSQAFIVSLSGSSVWALLPVMAQRRYGNDMATAMGLLSGALGTGALLGALGSRPIHQHLPLVTIIVMTAVSMMVFVASFGVDLPLPLSCLFAVGMGASWFIHGCTLNVFVRTDAPDYLGGDAVARFLMIFYLGLAAGSVVWGTVATTWGLGTAMVVSALGIAVSAFLGLQ